MSSTIERSESNNYFRTINPSWRLLCYHKYMQSKKVVAAVFLLILFFLLALFLNQKQETKLPISASINREELYKECTGTTLEGSCKNGECISPGMEKRVFDLWEQLFKRTYKLSDRFFNDHIKVTDTTYEVRTYRDITHHWWTVNYVYQNGWMKSRQNDSADLSARNDFTTISALTDEEIIGLLILSIRPTERFNAPVISFTELEGVIRGNNINPEDLDFCHIDFTNMSRGALSLRGISIVSETLNKCMDLEINLSTGKLDKTPDVCVIYD